MTIILNKEAKQETKIIVNKIAIPYETPAGDNVIAWLNMDDHLMKEGSCLKLNLIVEVKNGKLCFA